MRRRLRFREANCGLWGRLTLRVYRRGVLVLEDVENNILTNVGKVAWVKRLYDGLIGGNAIKGVDRIEVGDGGCDQSALFTPIPFAGTDTDLRTSINLAGSIQADPVVNVGNKSITFVAVLASALTNPGDFHYEPRVINEFALKTADPDNVTVALRATRSIIFDPSEAVEVEASWEIGLV